MAQMCQRPLTSHVPALLRQCRNDIFVAYKRALKVVGWRSGALPESGSEPDLFTARDKPGCRIDP
jgi:hypothetical protein